MKQTKTIKTLCLSAMVMAAMLMPLSVTAQNGGTENFFRSGGGDNYENRSGGGGISNHSFGNSDNPTSTPTDVDAPLDGGWIIMLVVGAGYTLLKKKED